MMTTEEMRVAIAEKCPAVFWERAAPEFQRHPLWMWNNEAILFEPLSDLNAIHEAETAMTEAQFEYYRMVALWHACGENHRRYVSATAAQRCEAFCRTLWPEKWEGGT